ncbi:anti-sigma-factor antagonist [Oceaniovalibus guishaninsula JLT2003]|uniref:Anti-sigma factor antagonist n=1 Tax=Oceaniovalibus guishaninsula JLT2003 TaxID=1231392 RepID=K2H9N6_9RHOB|nr:STAS domain-containing protein [Oceaniovalibus guishaninsula]EKE44263.1 anti-sigma-factor antagonist [Oceaniovalibus guishaninsula JLT2003]
MQLATREEGGVRIITVLADRVDAAIAVQFKDAVRDAAADHAGRVILDMGQVEFLDSSGLGAVIGARKHLAAGAVLELAALTPAVLKVFRLTRMDTIFVIHDGPAEGWVRADAEAVRAS